jgi:hypothetical protein
MVGKTSRNNKFVDKVGIKIIICSIGKDYQNQKIGINRFFPLAASAIRAEETGLILFLC